MNIMEKEILNAESVNEETTMVEKVELLGDELEAPSTYKKFKFEENPKYKSFIAKLDKFLYSDYYLLTIAAIIFIFWNIGYYARLVEVAGLILIVLLASFVLLVKDDATPIIPIIFMVTALFPVEVNPASYGLAILGVAPLPFALVYHLIHYRRKFKINKFFYSQLAVSIALIFGGIGTINAEGYKNGIAWVLLLGVAILAIYFIFSNYCKPKREIDLKTYLAKIMFYASMLIMFEVFVFYMRDPSRIHDMNERVSIGWCIGNNFSTWLVLLMPGTCYLAVKSKLSWLYTLLFLGEYVAIILSLSRGGILFALIVAPFFIAAMIYFGKAYRKGIVIPLVVVLVVGIIIIGATWEKTMAFCSMVINRSFSPDGHIKTSGRWELYAEAWNCFKANPIFGAGIGYFGKNYNGGTLGFYFFHSTLFQIIGCMGLVGLGAYIYNYVERFKIICHKDMFNIFILIGMLGFEGYAMIDTGTFVPMPSMIMVTLIIVVLELINERKEREWKIDLDSNGKLVSVLPSDEEDVSAVYGRVIEETEIEKSKAE